MIYRQVGYEGVSETLMNPELLSNHRVTDCIEQSYCRWGSMVYLVTGGGRRNGGLGKRKSR